MFPLVGNRPASEVKQSTQTRAQKTVDLEGFLLCKPSNYLPFVVSETVTKLNQVPLSQIPLVGTSLHTV